MEPRRRASTTGASATAAAGAVAPEVLIARHVANEQRGEAYRRAKYYSPIDLEGERVRIIGVTDRKDLNGRLGVAGALQPGTGRRLVVLDGGGGGAVPLKPANLQRAPPAPTEAIYNGGTGCYQPRTYARDDRPRRLRAGSGQVAHSTSRQVATPPIAPPLAGSLLPRHDPPTEFAEAFRDGALPVRMTDDKRGAALRWLDPVSGVEVPRSRVDARRWLPLLLDGLRHESAGGAYLALRGAIELAGSAARAGLLPSLMPLAAPALKAALDLRERSCVCAALRLLVLLLRAEPKVGLALRPHFRVLLPAIAAFKVAGQPDLGDEVEWSQHRNINLEDLCDEALRAMEDTGGIGTSALLKSYVPTWQRADVELHRGFR